MSYACLYKADEFKIRLAEQDAKLADSAAKLADSAAQLNEKNAEIAKLKKCLQTRVLLYKHKELLRINFAEALDKSDEKLIL